MDALKKPVAVYLGLSALAVLIHFWFSPFYPESWDVGAIWEVLDVFMAIGIILAVVYTCKHKRGLPSDASSLAQVCAYAAFYAAAVLAILFFWNWFDELAREGDQSQTRNNYWVSVINTLYIVLGATYGHSELPPRTGGSRPGSRANTIPTVTITTSILTWRAEGERSERALN